MTVTHAKTLSPRPSCVVIFAFKKENGVAVYSGVPAIKKAVLARVATGDFKGAPNEALHLYDLAGFERVVAFGIGTNTPPYAGEELRRNAHALLKTLKTVTEIEVDLSEAAELATDTGVTPDEAFAALAEGFILGAYRFKKYQKAKTENEETPLSVEKAVLVTKREGAPEAITNAVIVAQWTNYARDLGNEPSNALTALEFARRTTREAKNLGVQCITFDKKKIAALKMGGVIGVNKGSANPPSVIVLRSRAKKAIRSALVVGKGITFDSGGISIKPSQGMSEMKMDMGGGAAAVASLFAAKALALPINLTVIVPLTDNMPSGSSMNPGDIITMYNGLTVEIDNTDAEGRLILADGLAYGIKTYTPDVAIDIATLTGACIVALGTQVGALMTNTDALLPLFKAASEKTYERMWPLPLYDDYKKSLASTVADMKNVGGRNGGAINAGKFLERFVGNIPWAHLDIAGPAIGEAPSFYIPKDATGFGTRLLTEFYRLYAEKGI